jgi:nucleoid-associated protein YgaU
MTARSTGRIVAPYLAAVAVCSAALVFGITPVLHEPPVETGATTAAPTVSPSASSDRDESSAALATTQAQANAVAAELAVSPRSPVNDDSVPVFDIARIERTGEAVIAGRAAPGAVVELLGSGERLDQVIADPSGQFVMVPPRLPPGSYQLTLSSRSPDGTLATSKEGVAVTLDEVKSTSDAVQSRAEAQFNVPETAAPKEVWQDHAGRSSQARLLSPPPPLHIARRQDVAVSQLPHPIAEASAPDGGSSSPVIEPRILSTVVSRGDSLWRISRATYGAGTQYAVVYKANRDRIRNPNRIYPGQIFVLPPKAH